MTSQEEQLLNSLVERVNQTQLQEKDPDAEALLNQGLGANPDAHYIMAQTLLVQNIALEQAKSQVSQLQDQLQQAQQARQPARATSFLGNLLGHHDPPPIQRAQPTYIPPPPPPPGYDPQYQQGPYQQAPYGQPPYGQPPYGQAGPPSFMRGAMQTAAGVAAGALAFEGVESILHGIGGFGHPGFGMGMGGFGMGGGMMGAGMERPIEETIVNNYYDQPGGAEHHSEHSSFDQGGLNPGSLNQGGDHLHNSSDQAGAQFSDASYDTAGDDRSGNDLSTNDQGNYDDTVLDGNLTQYGGGYDNGDDGGGFDTSGNDDSGF